MSTHSNAELNKPDTKADDIEYSHQLVEDSSLRSEGYEEHKTASIK